MISLFLTNSIDPTRTITLRNKFVAEMRNRFASLMIDIRQAVIELDVFGLVEETRVTVNASGLSSKQYDFPRNDQKVEAFVKWLKAKNEEYFFTDGKQGLRMAFDLISSDPNSARSTWMKLYIDSAYQQGIRRARQELRKKGIEIDEGQLGGEPIVSAFNGPVHADRVGLIYTRAYSSLQGITAEMESVVSDVLAMGLADGRGPREIARLLNKAITGDGTGADLSIIDSLGRKVPARRRAEVLARTEVIRAHHSANIGEYKAAGILGINVQVEWLTAGDSRVCPKCSPMNGKLFQIDDAEYIIPAHPQCRCVALPYIPEDSPGRQEVLPKPDNSNSDAPNPWAPVWKTDAEISLMDYQTIGHQSINEYLRKGEFGTTPFMDKRITDIDSLFDKEVAQPVKLFRGDNGGASFDLFKHSGIKKEMSDLGLNFANHDSFLNSSPPSGKNWNEYLTEKLSGEIFEDKAFISTAKSKAIVDKKFADFAPFTPQGGQGIFHIKGISKSLNVDAITEKRLRESERLLPRGTKFKINKVTVLMGKTDGKTGPVIEGFKLRWDIEII